VRAAGRRGDCGPARGPAGAGRRARGPSSCRARVRWRARARCARADDGTLTGGESQLAVGKSHTTRVSTVAETSPCLC